MVPHPQEYVAFHKMALMNLKQLFPNRHNTEQNRNNSDVRLLNWNLSNWSQHFGHENRACLGKIHHSYRDGLFIYLFWDGLFNQNSFLQTQAYNIGNTLAPVILNEQVLNSVTCVLLNKRKHLCQLKLVSLLFLLHVSKSYFSPTIIPEA